MRTGMLALLGAAMLLMGAPRASAQAQFVPVTGTSLQRVVIPGVLWQTGGVIHMRDTIATSTYALDYGADGTVDRYLYTMWSVDFDIDAQTYAGPARMFVDVYETLGPNGLPDPASYLTTYRVTFYRQLASMNPPKWVTNLDVVMQLPSGEKLKWIETAYFTNPFAGAGTFTLVGQSLTPGRK